MKKRDKPLDLDEFCPCDSGFSYGDCCQLKGIKFFVSSNGEIYRRQRIHPNLKRELLAGEKRFRETFGRKPSKRDLVLFEHFLHGEEDQWQIIREIGRQANTPEHLIFAWQRSGFIVGEHSLKMMPDAHLDEWQTAVEEFFEIKKKGHDPFYVFTYLNAQGYERYKSCVKLIESIIVIGFNAIRHQTKFHATAYYFQYLMLRSALNSYRTINEMYRTRYDDDCLAILRGIYEQYLRLKFLRLKPESAEQFEATVNATVGIYTYKKRPNGSTDYMTIMDPKTGRQFRATVPNYTIVKASDFDLDVSIYEELYNALSGHVHHDVSAWALKEMATQKLYMDRHQDKVRSNALILFVSSLILYELLKLQWISKADKRDVRYCLLQLEKNLRSLIGSEGMSEHADLPICILPVFDRIRADT